MVCLLRQIYLISSYNVNHILSLLFTVLYAPLYLVNNRIYVLGAGIFVCGGLNIMPKTGSYWIKLTFIFAQFPGTVACTVCGAVGLKGVHVNFQVGNFVTHMYVNKQTGK